MYAMVYAPSFAEWLENVMVQQGLSQSELARRSGVTRSAINGVLKGTRGPGVDLANGIAKALKLPPEEVYRAAGLLPPAIDVDEEIERIIHEVEKLPPQDREEVLAFIRMKKNLRKKP
jgi:transcriptional regulator with XRE-family HTH domain